MDFTGQNNVPDEFSRYLSEGEASDSIFDSFSEVQGQIELLYQNRNSIETIIDIGCKHGGLATALGNYLNATTVYGVDINEESVQYATSQGVKAYTVDVENSSIPLEDTTIDLVVTTGLLEHLRYYDNLFEEVDRVLRNGWFWVTTPNLGSWLNRFSLLVGHQPRNIEISSQRAFGTLPAYNKEEFLDHVHAPTYKALLELLEYYNFDPIDSVPISPYQDSTLVRLLDWVFEHRISWSRRVAVLAKQR